jgi:hypothetical protein
VKVGDLVRHPGGHGDPPAIGIVIKKGETKDFWVFELTGRYIGKVTEAVPEGDHWETWYVISESPLTDHDHPDILQE